MKRIHTIVTTAAVLAAGLLTGCQSDSETTPHQAKTHAAAEATVPGSPGMFSMLGCDTVKSIQKGYLWTCEKDGAKAWFLPGDTSDPDTAKMAFDMITVSPGVHYNPDGDVFYSDEEGVLYVPGVKQFFQASLELVDPNGYGADVVDTDTL